MYHEVGGAEGYPCGKGVREIWFLKYLVFLISCHCKETCMYSYRSLFRFIGTPVAQPASIRALQRKLMRIMLRGFTVHGDMFSAGKLLHAFFIISTIIL